MSLAVFSTLFVPLMSTTMTGNDSQKKLQDAEKAMIFLGLGSCVGGPFNGFLIDKFGLKKSALMILVQTIAALAVILAYIVGFTWNVYFASSFAFLWGMQDSGVMNFIYSCCGF